MPNKYALRTEADEQYDLFAWAMWAAGRYPQLRLMYHIPNEGKRSAQAGNRLKAQGLRRGVPDICLPVPNPVYGALYIEMKRADGGRTTEDQRAWIDALNRVGNRAVVCHGFDDARREILRYLGVSVRET